MLRFRWLALVAVLFLNGCALSDFGGYNSNARGPASIVIDLPAQRAYLYKGKTLAVITDLLPPAGSNVRPFRLVQ
jgi:hypothetical protein